MNTHIHICIYIYIYIQLPNGPAPSPVPKLPNRWSSDQMVGSSRLQNLIFGGPSSWKTCYCRRQILPRSRPKPVNTLCQNPCKKLTNWNIISWKSMVREMQHNPTRRNQIDSQTTRTCGLGKSKIMVERKRRVSRFWTGRHGNRAKGSLEESKTKKNLKKKQTNYTNTRFVTK